MLALCVRKEFENITTLYARLAGISGLSESLIAKFYQQARPNPTQKTLDQLVAAIKVCQTRETA